MFPVAYWSTAELWGYMLVHFGRVESSVLKVIDLNSVVSASHYLMTADSLNPSETQLCNMYSKNNTCLTNKGC